jgi:hypothetical protein
MKPETQAERQRGFSRRKSSAERHSQRRSRWIQKKKEAIPAIERKLKQ